MAPTLLFDISTIDLNRITGDIADIESYNPHRAPMRMLDGIIHVDSAAGEGVAFKNIGADEFWAGGHIPGRPIFPAVLMIEASAQFASYLTLKYREKQKRFLGFVAADDFKFRGQVVPGDKLYVLCKEVEYRPGRRFISLTQGLVNGSIVFEGKVTGMPI
ncbi:MAG: beta-hydroxyacyl-ACP dehydratase [Phycisphaera sp.]|nr:beta-hydroxyacyl-ACP dehydratase [Phycisphaera sp.]